MFLRKITAIKNVGRFKAAHISGGNYERFALFYGGNGRGKTTLGAIVRSLQTNDATPILRRKTFKTTSEPEVGLLLDGGPVAFSRGAWSTAQPDIHLFDHQFVAKNVHGGDQVDVDHRRNFYRIVVGPLGVALAKEVDDLDAQVAAKQSEITTEKRVLEQHKPSAMTLEAFLDLQTDLDIDTKILDGERRLKAIADADTIATRRALAVLHIPALPHGFLELLGKTAEGIAVDAARKVQDHLDRHDFRKDGEAWIAKGLGHIVEDRCPMCDNPLAGNGLIDAYRDYFSEAYADHVKSLSGLDHLIDLQFPATAPAAFRTAHEDAQFWQAYCDTGYVAPDHLDRLAAQVDAVRTGAKRLLNRKLAAPLDAIEPDAAFVEAQAQWAATCVGLEATVASFPEANARIQGVKDANAVSSKSQVIAELAALKAVVTRHSEPVPTLAARYQELVDAKQALNDEKGLKKDALDAYDESILGAYETDINALLAVFGASFRLAQCKKSYSGRSPQSVYCLRFDSSDIDVTKAAAAGPGFDTAMSAGDKNTFALAFFLVQLKRDPDIARKLVLFDDPFTSLDDFRRAMTAKEIVRIGGTAAQTIVLSHDKHFLDAVHTLLHGTPCTTMQISATAAGSSIEPWDIAWEVKEGYLQDHMRLQEFAAGMGGDAREMRTVMRPLLEKYIRYRFPNNIPDGKWLGDMLAIIREDPTHPLTAQYQDLDDINGFTSSAHHDPNAPYTDDEVRTYAQRTVAIVGGC